MLRFNGTSAIVSHFVSPPREREKRDRRDIIFGLLSCLFYLNTKKIEKLFFSFFSFFFFFNYMRAIDEIPAGTWRKYNVASTSMQRHDVASTLRRRCIYVMCLPGSNWPKLGPKQGNVTLHFFFLFSFAFVRCSPHNFRIVFFKLLFVVTDWCFVRETEISPVNI